MPLLPYRLKLIEVVWRFAIWQTRGRLRSDGFRMQAGLSGHCAWQLGNYRFRPLPAQRSASYTISWDAIFKPVYLLATRHIFHSVVEGNDSVVPSLRLVQFMRIF
jgi:hypothetical protein